jgi:hypothetical protein
VIGKIITRTREMMGQSDMGKKYDHGSFIVEEVDGFMMDILTPTDRALAIHTQILGISLDHGHKT